jgi:hypothetical protein
MKVIKWIAEDDVTEDMEIAFGAMGGWFGRDKRDRWSTYYRSLKDEAKPYAEAIKDDVLRTDRFITGEQHQYSDSGVPIFEDGKIGSFSYRGWADLMAAIATLKDGKGHHYMEFYM